MIPRRSFGAEHAPARFMLPPALYDEVKLLLEARADIDDLAVMLACVLCKAASEKLHCARAHRFRSLNSLAGFAKQGSTGLDLGSFKLNWHVTMLTVMAEAARFNASDKPAKGTGRHRWSWTHSPHRPGSASTERDSRSSDHSDPVDVCFQHGDRGANANLSQNGQRPREVHCHVASVPLC